MKADLVSQLDDIWTPNAPLRKNRDHGRLGRIAQARKILTRLSRLKMESLELYMALPIVAAFHASTAKWRVVDGSNRAGKTLAGAVEYSCCVTGCDPYDKYPHANGNSLVIGLDGDHIAMMWRKCADAGAMMIVRDEQTRLWRCVRADRGNPTQLDPYDEAYREQWKEASPLIPARMIRHIAWEDRAKGIPRSVEYTTGWKTLFRSSEGKSPQGDHYNLGWIDEQISNEDFYTELCRGLVGLGESARHMPKAFWSATPQTTNQQLLDLRETAEGGSESVEAFKLLIVDNPYIPADEKQAFYDSLSDEERNVRWFGNYAIAGRRIYPHFSAMEEHGVEPFDIPSTWTRYCVLDPGRVHCGTIFAAVDPDEKHVWIYDEFDLRNADAMRWAQQVKDRQGEMRFEAFIIDWRMGRQHSPGSPDTVAELYYPALQSLGIQPRIEGPRYGFFPGSDNVSAREESLLDWLRIRGSDPFIGTPKLQVLRGNVPELEKQLKRAHMDHKNPDKRTKLPEDILVCLEYLAAFKPYYHEPEPVKPTAGSLVFQQFLEKQDRMRGGKPVKTHYQYA